MSTSDPRLEAHDRTFVQNIVAWGERFTLIADIEPDRKEHVTVKKAAIRLKTLTP